MTGRVTRQSLRLKEAGASQRSNANDESPAAEAPKVAARPKLKSTPRAKLKPELKSGKAKAELKADSKADATKGARKSDNGTPNGARRPSVARLSKESAISRELDEAMAALKKSEEDMKKYNLDEINQMKLDVRRVISKAKRDAQESQRNYTTKRPSKSTRSGLKRGAVRAHHEYTEGKYINIGMNSVSDSFDAEEQEYLKNEVSKVREVKDLKFEHIKYLIHYVINDELKGIVKGEVHSDFHDRYKELRGHSKKELQCEIRTSLFTNEQSDYINGYLQELFGGTKKGTDGGIQHDYISYIETVLMYETVMRIVRRVHGFESDEETLEFMRVKSREAYGISEDEDEDCDELN